MNRTKIVLIGDGRMGKTSLARSIMGQQFNAEEKSTVGMKSTVLELGLVNLLSEVESLDCKWVEQKERPESHLDLAFAKMIAEMKSNETIAEEAETMSPTRESAPIIVPPSPRGIDEERYDEDGKLDTVDNGEQLGDLSPDNEKRDKPK